jgi:hypothetical protein
MKRLLFLSIVLLATAAKAQVYDVDGLRFARTTPLSTARSMGVAGAFGSVGADLSATGSNPAGLALYRSSEVMLGMGIQASKTTTDYLGSSNNNNINKFTIPGAGVVFNFPIKAKKGMSFSSNSLRSVTLGITFQQLNNFKRTETFSGLNTKNSFAQTWVNQLNLNYPIDFYNYDASVVMPYLAGSIGYDTSFNSFYTYIDTPIQQRGRIVQAGNNNDVNIALGFNVNDKVYLGVDVGVPFMNYTVDNVYSEIDASDRADSFNYYNYRQQYRVSGIGVNAKFGIIFRPVPWYRGGIALHTPTRYTLDENYLPSYQESYGAYIYSVDTNVYAPLKYTMSTPMKGIISNSFYFREYGFFSVDYEFQNFGATKYKFSGYDDISASVNKTTKSKYGFGHTVRAGVEGAYKSLRVRAGYSFQSSPFKSGNAVSGFDGTRHVASAGLGYRGKSFFADFAWLTTFEKNYYAPYITGDSNQPGSRSTNMYQNFVLTIGFKFGKKNI